MTNNRSEFHSVRRRRFFEWGVTTWTILVISIAVVVYAREDVVRTSDGHNHIGRIVRRGDQTVTIVGRVKRGPVQEETIPLHSVEFIHVHGHRSVTGAYRIAADHWLRSMPLYEQGIHGFLYLPQAAQLFSPFAAIPPLLGEVLWRWLGLSAYALAIWRLSRLICDGSAEWTFAVASMAAVPACIGSLSNGQTNLVIGGLIGLAAADAAVGRRARPTFWLMASCALKPYMAIPVGLFALTHRHLRVAVILGAALLFLLPFASLEFTYVIDQYASFVGKMRAAGAPPDSYQDVEGMLHDFGVHLPAAAILGIRAAGGVATLAACMLARGRLTGAPLSIAVAVLGIGYVLVFNPRTEGVTYALIGPFAGLCVAAELGRKRWSSAAALIAYCIILQFSRTIAGSDNNWCRPLTTLLFLAWVTRQCIRGCWCVPVPPSDVSRHPERPPLQLTEA